jgi:hypothetical protein
MAGLFDLHQHLNNAQAFTVLKQMATFISGRIDTLVANKGYAWYSTLVFMAAFVLLKFYREI